VGSPFAMTYGGREIGSSLKGAGEAFKMLSSFTNLIGSMSSILGNYERRSQEWELQRDLAQHDIDQIQRQIQAAELRKLIAEKEIDIHEKNIEQTDEVYDFLKTKFSSKDLYQWMLNQLSGLYFQSYKLAYDLAKSAEKAYQYELNTDDVYINFGHWDSLKKGLLAGERLMLELNQMEKAYLENNARTLEIEKTISLAQLEELDQTDYGNTLLALRNTGKCSFKLTEELFDRDYPGHYCRKIKNISVSIPAIIGPYENIKATLTQKSNSVLMRPDSSAIQIKNNSIYLDMDSTNVRSNWHSLEQIAISKGINDSGMFELNFRDERYLPFEGTGAISEWTLEVPKTTNSFDFDCLIDVVINLKYTALFDGGLKKHITGEPQNPNKLTVGGYRTMSLKHEFSTEWHQFLNPTSGKSAHELTFSIHKNTFPGNLSNIEIRDAYLKLDIEKAIADSLNNFKINLTALGQKKELSYTKADVNKINLDQEFKKGAWTLAIDRKTIPGKLRKKRNGADAVEDTGGVPHYYLDSEKLKNIGMVLVYEGEINWFSAGS
jgi:hypothetical protein